MMITRLLVSFGAALLFWSSIGPVEAQTIVRIATTPPGRLYHIIGTGTAEILSKHSTLTSRVLPVGLGLSWAPMMERKEMEFAVLEGFEAHRVYHGTEEFVGPSNRRGYDIRYAVSGAPFAIGMPVRKDSDIQKLSDLKGKAVPTGYTAARIFDFYTRAILANAGLTYQDVVQVPVAEIARARELFMQGRVVTPGTWQPATGPVFEMDTAVGLRYLSLDPSPDAVKQMKQSAPGSYVIRSASLAGKTGVGTDTYLFALDTALVVHSAVPDQVVYDAVKALYEHNEEFRKFHLLLADWKREAFATERATVPYHPGAIKFYREKGLWPAAMEQLNERLKRK